MFHDRCVACLLDFVIECVVVVVVCLFNCCFRCVCVCECACVWCSDGDLVVDFYFYIHGEKMQTNNGKECVFSDKTNEHTNMYS